MINRQSHGYIGASAAPADGAVDSVNGQTGAVVLELDDFGVTATPAELNYVDGVTSNIQTQLNAAQAGKRTDTHVMPLQQKFTYVESFNTVLADYYGAGTITRDTTVTMDGGGSCKIALPAGTTLAGGIRDAFASPQDWSSKNFSIWVQSADWNKVNEIQLLLLSGGTYNDGVCFRLNIKQYLVAPTNNEWIQLIFNREQFTTVGAAVWTDIQKIIVRGSATSGQTTDIYFDQFTVFDEVKAGYVSIDFDDGWASIYDAATYMSTKGLVGSLHVIPSLLGTAGYMTQAQVDDLARRGWEISGHGLTNLATLTTQQVDDDVRQMREYLNQYAYKGSDFYAYPEGVNNLAIRNIVGKYFSAARDVLFISQPAAWVAPYNIHSYAPIESTLTADITQRITDTLTKGTWQVLTFHKIVTTPTGGSVVEYSTANFQTVIDFIVSSGATCLPKSQVVERLSSNPGVIAPASSTDNAITRFDGTSGKIVQNSTVIIDDTGTMTLPNAANIAVGTATGTQIATATTQKLGFFAATPVVQQLATVDLGVVLSNLGLRAAGTAYPINTSGSAAFTGAFASGSGGGRSPITNRTGNATLTATSPVYNTIDATAGNITITLPLANASNGQCFKLKRTDGTANTVTIARAGSDTIDGAASYTLPTQYKYVHIHNNNSTSWWVMGNN